MSSEGRSSIDVFITLGLQATPPHRRAAAERAKGTVVRGGPKCPPYPTGEVPARPDAEGRVKPRQVNPVLHCP